MKKKYFVLCILMFIIVKIYSITTPEELKGIWQGKDRILFIGDENEFSIILKLYYGWYYDYALEADVNLINKEKKNAASSSLPQNLTVSFNKIIENSTAYEITISSNNKPISCTPVAVINNELYLNFLIKPEKEFIAEKNILENKNNDNFLGYWQGINNNENIRISTRNNKNDIYSWYILDNAVYRLRFWKTDIKYENDSMAAFTDGENIFSINKHIFSGTQNYTCATGKSSRIRNVEKYSKYPNKIKIDSSERILVEGNPNFVKADASDREKLITIINEANKRRKQNPPPLFEEKEINWHWDLINELEKDNKIIQDVRERQKKFGNRDIKTNTKK